MEIHIKIEILQKFFFKLNNTCFARDINYYTYTFVLFLSRIDEMFSATRMLATRIFNTEQHLSGCNRFLFLIFYFEKEV